MSTSDPLAAALDKLTDAVDAAEAAASARETEAAKARDAGALEASLSELRRDHAGLKSVAEDVSRRLEDAIEQVEAILAGRP